MHRPYDLFLIQLILQNFNLLFEHFDLRDKLIALTNLLGRSVAGERIRLREWMRVGWKQSQLVRF